MAPGTYRSRATQIGTALALVFVTPQASANDAESAAERGKAVVQQWCSTCHAETQEETGSDMAPPFEAVASRPSNNPVRLRAFLDEDHFPMTTFRLFSDEKDDVVAYLVTLRARQADQ